MLSVKQFAAPADSFRLQINCPIHLRGSPAPRNDPQDVTTSTRQAIPTGTDNRLGGFLSGKNKLTMPHERVQIAQDRYRLPRQRNVAV